MFENDDFMKLISYRNMVIEEKVQECLVAAKNGKTEIVIDTGDLTDHEVEYLRNEVKRRFKNCKY